jgi:hypothetical protein
MAADMDPEPTGAIHLGKVEKKNLLNYIWKNNCLKMNIIEILDG